MKRPRTSTAAVSASVATLALALGAAPASARPLESYPYDVTDAYSFDDCGFPVDEVDHFTGDYTVKDSTPKTGGEYFRVHNRYRFTYVLTNADTGVWIRIEASGNFREGPGTVVSDDGRVVRYVTKESGAFQTVYDSSGAVLARDRGTITVEYTFDSLGDGQPGGDILSEKLVKVAGPHPVYDEPDGCALLTDWIG
jgi:hypothetical protein